VFYPEVTVYQFSFYCYKKALRIKGAGLSVNDPVMVHFFRRDKRCGAIRASLPEGQSINKLWWGQCIMICGKVAEIAVAAKLIH
jgi:hypothetical protein